jgi:glycosyltransferase involved in cell wall biosynthesis
MKQKPIFIDGLGLVESHFSGVGQYILGIVRGIDDLIDQAKYRGEPVPDVCVIIPYNARHKFREFEFKHIRYKAFPMTFRLMSTLWHRGKLPPIDLWYGRGSYIFPRFVSMPLLFSKSALVIFDLSYELHREYSDEGNAVFLSKQVSKSLQKVDKVITISQNARREIIDFYKVDPKSVTVATPATDPRIFYRRSNTEIVKVKQRYGITGDYILALSNLEPRKNLSALVEAYCMLPKEVTNKVALVLVGVSGWKTEALFRHIVEKVEQGYNIIRPSHYVRDDHKPAIISGAKLLVYPSHYEGFGMPPLEALACGVPVITADNSSLPEVVGKLSTMINSHDIKGLSREIEKALKQSEAVSKKMMTAGPERARQFSWTDSAQVFLDAVKEIES